MSKPLNRKFSVAPMMDWTDRHCRAFHRCLTRHAVLYTEMVTTGALLYGDVDRHLAFDRKEHPVALQLGGSDPAALAECVTLAEEYGYDEVNLNIGCPSDRVQNGRFGACLMVEPELVGKCVAAMQDTTSLPVTVKCRIGIDDQDDFPALRNFVEIVAEHGCGTFMIHARKAWLEGLSPKQNRNVPPLKYDLVYRIKDMFPALEIIINGGIKTHKDVHTHLQHVDGVMVGREAYTNPYLLAEVDTLYYGAAEESPVRAEVIAGFSDYIRQQIAKGIPLKHMTRHTLGLYQGQPGAKAFRRHLSEQAHLHGAGVEVFERAVSFVEDQLKQPVAA